MLERSQHIIHINFNGDIATSFSNMLVPALLEGEHWRQSLYEVFTVSQGT